MKKSMKDRIGIKIHNFLDRLEFKSGNEIFPIKKALKKSKNANEYEIGNKISFGCITNLFTSLNSVEEKKVNKNRDKTTKIGIFVFFHSNFMRAYITRLIKIEKNINIKKIGMLLISALLKIPSMSALFNTEGKKIRQNINSGVIKIEKENDFRKI